MQYDDLHPLKGLGRTQMEEIQHQLASQVRMGYSGIRPEYVCGVDVAYDRRQNRGYCAIVTLEYESRKLCETVYADDEVHMPYIPGFLAFRELPLFFKAWEKQTIKPDIVFFDGNGLLHQKRLGIASHAGLFIKIPTIGIAKSYLCGHSEMLPGQAGAWVPVTVEEEVIGAVLRTRKGCKPVYVSIGDGLSLEEALLHTQHFSDAKYRIPCVTRLADKASKHARDGKGVSL